MKNTLTLFFNKIQERGIDVLNDYFPRFNSKHDLYSEQVKTILKLVGSFSILMMVTSPIGWMYACFPRPFYVFIFYLHRIGFTPPSQPEWGIHYVTLLVYSYLAYTAIEYFEEQGINKPFHKLCYVFLLTIVAFYVPFEIVYITLYDIFHSIPLYGFPTIWFAGLGSGVFSLFNLKTVIMTDIFNPLCCIVGMWIIKNDLQDYYNISFKKNRWSLLLFTGYIVTTLAWIYMPVYYDGLPEWGTNYFPQTVYMEYGYYEDFNMEQPREGIDWGIVYEHWHPDDLIKILNHLSKLFSVSFMFYTFLPRRKAF